MNVVLMLGGLLLMAIGTAEIWRWAGGRRMSKTEKACRGQAVVLVLPEGPEDCECRCGARGSACCKAGTAGSSAL